MRHVSHALLEAALGRALGKLGLSEDNKSEISAEIETLHAQLASPKPKPSILKESLASITAILEGAAGNVLASGLLSTLTSILS